MTRNRSLLFHIMSALLVLLPLAGMPAGASASAQDNASVFDPSTFDIGLELVAGGLDQPLFVTDANDGSSRLFVVERGGMIRILENGTVSDAPFLDITDRVNDSGMEQGLLGLAFAPNYTDSGFFYVNYIDRAGNTVVSRFSVSDDPAVADGESESLVLRQKQPYPNHNGGVMIFGPDNYLYIAFGDGGSGGDPQGNAQRLDTWLGKILRVEVDPEQVPAGEPYSIPEDNPFIDQEDADSEIWAYGLRNPWRFSFDLETGDMWIGDVGQSEIEEIDILPIGMESGQNLGWNVTEGTNCYLESGCDTTGFVMPVMEYTHRDGNCSVTGGYVYRGEDIPDLIGTYLFGDYCSGYLWGGGEDADGQWVMSDPIQTGFAISSFGEDDAGNVYVTDLAGGGVYRLSPAL